MREKYSAFTSGHDLGDGRRTFSREELYALVWQTPMTRLAPTFGLSDVGLRKICAKHDIPTPPLGYWAKLAHGKRVHKPPLPPGEGGGVQLIERTRPAMPPAITAAQDAALAVESARPRIVVPAERPANLHPVATATAKALNAARIDHEGFRHGKLRGAVPTALAPASIDRALRLIDAFARAAEERAYGFAEDENGVRLVVEGVPVAWRVYEIRGRTAHIPTRSELKEQVRREENRAKWPSLYSSVMKAHATWDYLPSGKLAMTFTDASRFRWGRDGLIGHWYDRKGRRLEEYLDDAMTALIAGVVTINHRLAAEAESEHKESVQREVRRREQAKRERAMKRHEFLLAKADGYARLEKLAAFAKYMEREVDQYRDEPIDRLIEELKTLVSVVEAGFARDALAAEIAEAQLYTADDPVAEPADEWPA